MCRSCLCARATNRTRTCRRIVSGLPPSLRCCDDLACASECTTVFRWPPPQKDARQCKSGPYDDSTFENDDFPSVDTPRQTVHSTLSSAKLSPLSAPPPLPTQVAWAKLVRPRPSGRSVRPSRSSAQARPGPSAHTVRPFSPRLPKGLHYACTLHKLTALNSLVLLTPSAPPLHREPPPHDEAECMKLVTA